MGNWQEVKVSSVYEALFDGPHATPNICDEGPVFLSIANLSETGELNLTKVKCISDTEFPRWTKRVIPQEGDIVFTYEASLHRYAVIPKNFTGCLGRRLALVRPDNSKAHYKYLFYYFLSDSWKKEVGNYILSGTTVDRVPLTKFPQFKLRLPNLSTQKKIAAILSAYDDLIENNKRRIVLLENMAEEIYREWFVRFRFPGYQIAEFEKGIPKEWCIKSIDKLCLKVTDGSHASPDLFESGKFMASVKDMTNYGFNKNTMKTISEKDFESLVKSDCQPKKNDILIAKDGSYLKHVFVWSDNYDVVLLSSIAILRPDLKKVSPLFLSMMLRQPSTKSMMSGYVSGSALPRIILKDFKKMELMIPAHSVMDKFESIISPIYKNIKNLDASNEKLSSLKEMLLPRLISGKLSVENLDIQFPPSMLGGQAVVG